MKKIPVLILSIAIIISIVPINAFAAPTVLSGVCGENLTWRFDDDYLSLIISGTGDMYNYTESTVPWLGYSTDHIVIDNGVTSIGNYAFDGNNIGTVSLGNSVASIGVGAFRNCKNLKSITIPNEVLEIADYTFEGCEGLVKAEIGNKVTTIGKNAFRNCTSLIDVTLPVGISKISDGAFKDCSALTDIYYSGTQEQKNQIDIVNTLNNNSKLIDAIWHCEYNNFADSGSCGDNLTWAFVFKTNTLTISGTGNMDNYYFDKNYITTAPWGKYCDKMEYAIIESGVTSIGDYAFDNCQNLKSITIADGLTRIGKEAFCNCLYLSNISLPSSVQSFGEYAFDFCESITSITIPDGVTELPNGLFIMCISLNSLVIPSSVKIISDEVFHYCDALETIVYLGTIEEKEKIINVAALEYLTWKCLGNISLDDFVSQADKTSILVKVLLGTIDGINCDMNGDTKVDILDYVVLKKQIAQSN